MKPTNEPTSSGSTLEERVRRDRERSGVPEKVEDPEILRRLAVLLRPTEAARHLPPARRRGET